MYCVNHTHENGVNTCNKCGAWLCEKCSVEINGRIFCKSCISDKMSGPHYTPPPSMPPVKAKSPSFIVLLMFSCIMPGLNYMYLGLMKRGLFFLSAFFSIIFILTVTGFGLFGFFIPILWITSVFDGFEKRRRMINGIFVPDNVDEIIEWFKKYKSLIVFTLIALFGLYALSEFSTMFFRHMPFYHASKSILSIVILILGIKLLYNAVSRNDKSKKRHGSETDN